MNELAVALLIVFAINLAPAFMPPTWMVLAFAHLVFGVELVPLAIGGALAAAGGRLVLAIGARRYGIRLLRPAQRLSLERLGAWLEAKSRWAAPVAVLVYSFGPIPSNQLFVAAGLAKMRLGRIAGAFLAGRLISYPFWIGAARVAATRLDELFSERLLNAGAIAIDLAMVATLLLFTRIDWVHLIDRVERSERRREGAAAPRAGT